MEDNRGALILEILRIDAPTWSQGGMGISSIANRATFKHNTPLSYQQVRRVIFRFVQNGIAEGFKHPDAMGITKYRLKA